MVFELVKWQRVIRERGVWGAVKSFWQFSDIKQGRLVGTDKFGNKYYENLKDEPILGRDRWVDYNQKVYPREPSFIPPEWHAWMHRMTDVPPNHENASLHYVKNLPDFVQKVHNENYTGSARAYKPYSTVKPKYEAWDFTKSKANDRN